MTPFVFMLVDMALLVRTDVAFDLWDVDRLDAYTRARRERRLKAAAMTWVWWRSTWLKTGG